MNQYWPPLGKSNKASEKHSVTWSISISQKAQRHLSWPASGILKGTAIKPAQVLRIKTRKDLFSKIDRSEISLVYAIGRRPFDPSVPDYAGGCDTMQALGIFPGRSLFYNRHLSTMDILSTYVCVASPNQKSNPLSFLFSIPPEAFYLDTPSCQPHHSISHVFVYSYNVPVACAYHVNLIHRPSLAPNCTLDCPVHWTCSL